MRIEIKVPALPESVSEATIAAWHKKLGEPVKRDEHLVDIETDKVVLEVVAPEDGYLEKVVHPQGATVHGQEIIALFTARAASDRRAPSPPAHVQPAPPDDHPPLSPATRRARAQHAASREPTPDTQPTHATPTHPQQVAKNKSQASKLQPAASDRRVPMSRLRARIAERLLQAQHSAAILTTFNEINMGPVMALRQKYKEAFEKAHGVRLGLMSFFVQAAIEALKRYPIVNASIEDTDILYHDVYDIGIAVSSPRGLVVPILRDAAALSLADIEIQIAHFGEKAKTAQLTLEEITGGTFTLSNGGVFGSLLSTPILNPPQSAILGLHKIEDRPIVENQEIVIRPMMYVALSYDHRLIDGSDSVRFLVAIKEVLEDPARLLLEI